MKSLSRVLMGLAARGYRWYVALKIGKAICAVPVFVLWLAYLAVGGTLIVIWESIKAFVIEVPVAIYHESREFWTGKWFRGFSRDYYNSLGQYGRAPAALPPEDVE